ncbi:MAG TPA: hypothetical protein VK675_03065 [Candidatus Paceibacterota bacterium]|nr:hypothetical protein [Candidatus Paceibacterota bacterium]
MKQGPPAPTPEPGPKILSFEKFIERVSQSDNLAPIPRYNNFYLYFDVSFAQSAYQTKKYYIKFLTEHPRMNASLCDKIQNQRNKSKGTSESLKPFERDLYEAYKIMRSYGISDKKLFS